MSRAFVYGDEIDTDALAPGHAMKLTPEAMARYCLEPIDPSFASTVQPGDILVAGENFGLGSSREQAAISLKILGLQAVFAKSFARIFYRNAINAGLPAILLPQADEIGMGDQVAFDLTTGQLQNLTTGKRYQTPPLPAHLLTVIADGGLIAHLKRRFKGAAA
jgi:3-isopropylmalate/(R)-2-methylmalate dehydratase small subunit